MTQLVGIVNVTPDSFSDGGRFALPEAAYRHVEGLIRDGARVVDVGAESTRPGAVPLEAEAEKERLAPVLPDIITLCHRHGVRVSVDTRHAATAEYALGLAADWINDVSSGASARLLHAVRACDADYVLMHSLGVPADPAVTLPQACDPVEAVYAALRRSLEDLENAGIARGRVIVDPGLGFGKDAAQSLALLWDAPRFAALGCRVLIGHSRKSFLTSGLPAKQTTRDALTLLASSFLMRSGIDYIRVHELRIHATLAKRLARK